MTWISFAVLMASLVASALLHVILNHPAPLLELLWPELSAILLAGASFVTMVAAAIAGLVVPRMLNAALRRNGQPATAKVLAVRDTGSTVNNQPVVRIKLEVHPPGGVPFEAVAEDSISRIAFPRPGTEVSVRFDPRTKAVALERVDSPNAKTEDF